MCFWFDNFIPGWREGYHWVGPSPGFGARWLAVIYSGTGKGHAYEQRLQGRRFFHVFSQKVSSLFKETRGMKSGSHLACGVGWTCQSRKVRDSKSLTTSRWWVNLTCCTLILGLGVLWEKVIPLLLMKCYLRFSLPYTRLSGTLLLPPHWLVLLYLTSESWWFPGVWSGLLFSLWCESLLYIT